MAVTNWRSPGTVTEDTSVGTDVFTNPGNVANAGSPYATINWGSGTKTSSRIKATNFNFAAESIPGGSTIDGIEFRYDRVENSTTDNLETKEIYYIDSSGVLQTATNNADTGEWPTTRATSTVGGAANLMGYTGVTLADILNSNFGFSFRCGTIGSGTTPAGDCGVFQARIHYTEGSGVYNDTITETATATDSRVGTASDVATITESSSATDSLTGGKATSDSLSESATVTSSEAGTAIGRPTLSETGTATDSASAARTGVATLSEAATSSDSRTGTITGVATLTESSSTADSYTDQGQTYNETLTETASTTDSISGARTASGTCTESSIAGDNHTSVMTGNASLSETTAANDNYAGSSDIPDQEPESVPGPADRARQQYLQWLKKKKRRKKQKVIQLTPPTERLILSMEAEIEQSEMKDLIQQRIAEAFYAQAAHEVFVAIRREMEELRTEEEEEEFLWLMA